MLRKLTLLNHLTPRIMAEGDNASLVKIATEETVKIFEADFGFIWGRLHLGDAYQIIHKTKNTPFDPVFPFVRTNPTEIPPFFDEEIKQKYYKTKLALYFKSYIVVPIRYFDNSYGNIVLGFKKIRKFTKEELALSTTIGNTIAQSMTINWLVESERKALVLSEKQEAHFRALVENSYEIIIHLNPKGEILYVSPSIKKIMGLEPKNFLGKNIINLSGPDEKKQVALFLKKILAQPSKRHVEEFTSKSPDGAESVFESTSAKLPEVEGGGGIVINIRDITEHKKLEKAKKAERELQEEKIKVDSIADATHELRTPLAIIRGNLDLARIDHLKDSKSVKNIINDIDVEVKHLSEIISDLALITSKPRGASDIFTKEDVSIPTLVKECVNRCQSLAYKKNIKIEVKDIKKGYIKGSRDYLEKMLINLVKNSINYGRQYGHTKVSTIMSKGFVTINIQDDGIGIYPEDLEHVFERFYRGDRSHSSYVSEGTGLGLSIVKWIAESHQGSIAVKSTVNKGSIFSVKLPLSQSKA